MNQPTSNPNQPPIGQRIHITGMSCSGKSTLGAELAQRLGLPLVELDALNWLPNWVGLNATDPEKLESLIAEATAGHQWVIAGSYEGFCKKVCWDRLETVLWLDLPRSLLIRRVLRRSWKRSRTKELLWGTNYERFLPHLKVWNRDESLLWWIWTQHKSKKEKLVASMLDPQWSHIRFIRLTSVEEIEQFLNSI